VTACTAAGWPPSATPCGRRYSSSKPASLNLAPHQEIRNAQYRDLGCGFEPEVTVEPHILRPVGLKVAGRPGSIQLFAVLPHQLLADSSTLGTGVDADRAEM
jgi:hypothetical protein